MHARIKMVFQGIITCPDGHLIYWCVTTHDEVTTPFPMIVLQLSTAGVEAKVYKALNLGSHHVQIVDNLKTLRKMKASSHQKLNPCMASLLMFNMRQNRGNKKLAVTRN